jgi:hypothetical protein
VLVRDPIILPIDFILVPSGNDHGKQMHAARMLATRSQAASLLAARSSTTRTAWCFPHPRTGAVRSPLSFGSKRGKRKKVPQY